MKIKKNEIFIRAIAFLLAFNLFLANTNAYHFTSSIPLAIGIFITFIYVMYFAIINKIEALNCLKDGIRHNFAFFIFMLLIGISFLISGITYKVPTYLLYFIFFFFSLPSMVFAINKDTMELLLKHFINFLEVMIAITIVACLLFVPIDDKQYYGTSINPNTFGTMLSLSAIVLIYKYETAEKKVSRIFPLVCFGIVAAFTFFTKSRTTLLVMMTYVIIYMIYIGRDKRAFLQRFRDYSIVLIVSIPITFCCLSNITPAIVNATGIDYFVKIKAMDYEKENLAVQDSGSLENTMDSTISRYLKGVKDNGNFASGRPAIWKIYFDNLKLKGHTGSNLYIPMLKGTFYPHNTFLQVAYQGGIIAGISFVGFCLFIFFRLCKKVKSRDSKLNLLFYGMIFSNSLIIMMLGGGFTPYRDFATGLFWILLASYICLPNNKERLKI